MIVYKTNCLQVGVTDCGTEKFETAFFHIAAQGSRFRRTNGNLAQRRKVMHNRFLLWQKRQNIVIKAAEFFLDRNKQPCVDNDGFYLQAVFDDAVKSH